MSRRQRALQVVGKGDGEWAMYFPPLVGLGPWGGDKGIVNAWPQASELSWG